MALSSGCAQEPKAGPLIARCVLFGNPDKVSLKVSPDGRRISFLAPRDGVMNVWAAPADDPSKAVPVTADKLRGVRSYFWAYTNEHIIYLQDLGGDENRQVHAVHIDTKEDRNLTPFDEIVGPDGEALTGPDGKKLRPRTRIRPAGEPPVLQRRGGHLPGQASRRTLRADRERLRRLQHRGPHRRRIRSHAQREYTRPQHRGERCIAAASRASGITVAGPPVRAGSGRTTRRSRPGCPRGCYPGYRGTVSATA